MERLDPATFDLPVKKIQDGYYSDAYFNHTRDLLIAEGRYPKVVMQVFQKRSAYLAGIDEAIAVLKLCSGCYNHDPFNTGYRTWAPGWSMLKVTALEEGQPIKPYEPVMHIEGPYHYFAHLETVYLGILSRRTLIATNVKEVTEAAGDKPIFFFPARHDHWMVQTGDGYTAFRVGCAGVSTDAQASWWGGKGMGTVPHALIAAYDGDTVAAAVAFADKYHEEMDISVLVDFNNNSCDDALAVAEALGPKLWGVRLDTSERMIDECLTEDMYRGTLTDRPTGVTEDLVWKVRQALDYHGHGSVRIVVSGGFTAEKVARFEHHLVPVDAYGVGASLIRGDNAFTADIVKTDGAHTGKAGRRYTPNPRLRDVT